MFSLLFYNKRTEFFLVSRLVGTSNKGADLLPTCQYLWRYVHKKYISLICDDKRYIQDVSFGLVYELGYWGKICRQEVVDKKIADDERLISSSDQIKLWTHSQTKIFSPEDWPLTPFLYSWKPISNLLENSWTKVMKIVNLRLKYLLRRTPLKISLVKNCIASIFFSAVSFAIIMDYVE